MTLAVSLEQVQVQRGVKTLLQVDHWAVDQGQAVALIGVNGAGKTTLLKTCCGLIKPDRGRVMLNRVDWATLSPWQRSKQRRCLGYVPQRTEFAAELPLTVTEVVTMGRVAIKGLGRRLRHEDHNRVSHWIDRLGLDKQARQTFRSLSGGEQQKVLIARAMAREPDILMLDEPCANLDIGWKSRITSLIESLHQETQITLIMVCHEMSLIPACCHEVLLLDQGRAIVQGPLEEVLQSPLMERVYGCHLERVVVDGRHYVVGGQAL